MTDLTQLGRYKIIRELGRGGMGVVYEGKDPLIDRTVALKVIKLQDFADVTHIAEMKERFLREAQAAGKLSHPSIVTVYDIGEDGANTFFAMEFVDGRSLADVIKTDPLTQVEKVVEWAVQIGDALDYAHENGIVHRDIKPGNILLTKGDRVKITDFGLARLQSAGHLTRTGQAVGTPSYMSPEQIQGVNVDGRSDLYSLGVIVYELLTKERPFVGESVSSVMFKIMKDTPVAPSDLNIAVNPSMDAVIYKMLSKNPAARFQKGKEFSESLKKAMTGAALAGADLDRTQDVTILKNMPVFTPGQAQHQTSASGYVPAQGAPTPYPMTPPSGSYPPPASNPMVKVGIGIAAAIVVLALALVFRSGGGEKVPAQEQVVAPASDGATAQAESVEPQPKEPPVVEKPKDVPPPVVAQKPKKEEQSKAPGSAQEAPANFSGSSDKNWEARLTWTPHPASNIVGYSVYKSESADGKYERIGTIQGRTVTSYIDTEEKTRNPKRSLNYYKISALTDTGGESAKTAPLEISYMGGLRMPPTGLKAKSGLEKLVELNWEIHPDKSVSGYYLFRGSTPDNLQQFYKVFGRTVVNYDDTGQVFGAFSFDKLEDGKKYYYAISAYNNNGAESPRSQVVSATTLGVAQ